MDRRAFLAASATGTALVLAGCSDPDDDDDNGTDVGYRLETAERDGPYGDAESRSDRVDRADP